MTKIIRAVTIPMSLGFCRELMIKMRGMGYDMVALSSSGWELDELRDVDRFRTIVVEMERHISPLKDLKSLVHLIKVFRKEKPNVVHSMTPKAGLLCMMAGWLAGVPVRIHTFTGLVWPTSSGIKRQILKITDRITCACATHVIPEGQGVLNDLSNGGITRKPMKVLGYGNVRGIDLEVFDPSKVSMGRDDDRFTFLFVGRIVRDKGINELVDAFVALHDEHPETRLVLVGPFEDNVDPVNENTRRMIEQHEAIEWVGAKYGDDLLRSYASVDCLVMPSYREGFPNTVIEAGAMGLPSIVTDINGSREIIEEGQNGLIVPPRDMISLCTAMKRMVEDEVLREQFKRNARTMVASRFEKNFVQQCLIDYYKEILIK